MKTLITCDRSALYFIGSDVRVCKIEKQTDDHVQKYDAKQQRADIKKRISSVLCDLFIFLEQIQETSFDKSP